MSPLLVEAGIRRGFKYPLTRLFINVWEQITLSWCQYGWIGGKRELVIGIEEW